VRSREIKKKKKKKKKTTTTTTTTSARRGCAGENIGKEDRVDVPARRVACDSLGEFYVLSLSLFRVPVSPF